MKSTFTTTFFILTVIFLSSGFVQADLNGCESDAGVYTPYQPPIEIDETTEPTDISIIIIHGKNGSPYFSNLLTLYDELKVLGYRIVAPVMPWGGQWIYNEATQQYDKYLVWDGTRCQGLKYLESLIAAERGNGKRVLLMGHSMGGSQAFLYGHLNTVNDIEGIIASAPGHILPYAKTLINETAASVQKALNLVANGKGGVTDTFQTYNNGGLETITTTPRIYLSYHNPDPDLIPDTDHFPDMSVSFPNITEPVQWLVGSSDSLLDFYNRNELYQKLPATPQNEFKVLNGDHLSVILNESSEIHRWFTSWSSINPADRDRDGVPDKDDLFPDDPSESEDSDKDGIGENADADDDNDGLSDTKEGEIGSDPLKVDTDGDGYNDLEEYEGGSDPNNPDDVPSRGGSWKVILPYILDMQASTISGSG